MRLRSKPRPRPLLITESDPKSAAAEAYRTLRTNIQFAGVDQPCRTMVFTSAGPGEGKTTSVANFGIVAAEAGVKVCLVDSDLRRPALHRLFGLPNTRGLTSALIESLSLADVAQRIGTSSLSIVTSGPLPPNPAELVASKRMASVLQAESAFDLILCDSPPVISVADGIALAAQCDGVVLVVRAGMLAYDAVRRAVENIESVKGRILGVVLNSVNLRRDAYYTYYRYYGRYYGTNGRP
jgi:capsular exopolysaccharide synthesis family protein